jgi:hypothetical protein
VFVSNAEDNIARPRRPVLTGGWIVQAVALAAASATAFVLMASGVLRSSSAPAITAALLLVPAALLATALIPWRGRRVVAAIATVAVVLFCVAASASVGWAYLPAAACAVVAVAIPERMRRREHVGPPLS